MMNGGNVAIEENGKTVKCPVCKSDNIVKVHPFDYVKQCNNDNCEYYIDHSKNWRCQFTTGVHN